MMPARRVFSRAFVLCAALLFVSTSQTQASGPTRHTVNADGHPVAVWEKRPAQASVAVLLVHGRTWSALPDFDLQVDGEDLSLMDGLVARGYAVYALDLRGYGETPRDETGWLTPGRAADDVTIVLDWIAHQEEWGVKPHLFGWSMGSTISQLAAQRHPDAIASLTLFGYWHDPDHEYPADEPDMKPQREANTAKAAASDFVVPGSISEKAVAAYVKAALASDPIKTDLRGSSDYNALDPARLTMPTLVIHGMHDPLAPTENLAKLYTRIGTGYKQWVSVPGGDHAAFLESPRAYFINELVTFMKGATQMTPDSHTHHAIDYIEFTVTDMAASKRFYEAAFDWKFNDYGPDYAGIQGQGREAGGLRLDTKISPGGPLVVLYSRDLDMSLARVRDAGGRIVKEPFDFPGGRRFQFRDPSGNELAVYSER